MGEKLYNPFDALLFLDTKMYRPYWFETGTPTFLIKLILQNGLDIPSLERIELGDEMIESFDIGRIHPETLLFQTGYLTIVGTKRRGVLTRYILDWPNLEVKMSFNSHLLNYFTDLRDKERNLDMVCESLEKADMEKMERAFRSFFSSIPSDWYRKNDTARYEGFYSSVFYAYFAALGIDVRAEDATSKGRIDLSVMFDGRCFIFEFKVLDGKRRGDALRQLKERRYHEKFVSRCDEIYLVGVEFDKDERNIVNFEWKKMERA